jgi:hypothetical protein
MVKHSSKNQRQFKNRASIRGQACNKLHEESHFISIRSTRCMQVRHAQAVHNVQGVTDHDVYLKPEFFDAQLTPLGWTQVSLAND